MRIDLTEDAAKAKMCPFISYALGHVAEVAHDKCIGSECMAWQKGRTGWERQDGTIIDTYREPANYHGGRWIERGFCARAAGSDQRDGSK